MGGEATTAMAKFHLRRLFHTLLIGEGGKSKQLLYKGISPYAGRRGPSIKQMDTQQSLFAGISPANAPWPQTTPAIDENVGSCMSGFNVFATKHIP
jgi:hypothetical protein